MKIYPKRILNVEISSTGIHKVWFLKYLGVTYLILVLASSFILLFLHRSIFDREKESFNEKVEYLFNSSFFNESNNIEDVLTKLKKVNNIKTYDFKYPLSVVLIDDTGKILFKSRESENLLGKDAKLPMDLFKRYDNGTDIVNLNKSKEKFIFVSKRIIGKENGTLLGHMIFLSSTKKIRSNFLNLAILLLFIFLFVFLLLFFINKHFINFIVSQINKVSKVARCIALGDFKTRILKSSNDELGELCDTINYMAQKLFESERMKNDFISSISHELRTPLTAIKGWAETIKIDENEKDAKINNKGLQIIANESERLYNIVEQLLDFSKLQSARVILKLEKMDILAELSESVYMFRKKAKDENKILLYTEPESLPAVLGDKNRLKQVLINVIDNALKYTEPYKGVVNINAKESKNFIKITISDNGCGISKDDLPKVKTKFYKGNNQKPGSGIGLAIANELILLHSGKLEIKSEENIGTVISIYVPIVKNV